MCGARRLLVQCILSRGESVVFFAANPRKNVILYTLNTRNYVITVKNMPMKMRKTHFSTLGKVLSSRMPVGDAVDAS